MAATIQVPVRDAIGEWNKESGENDFMAYGQSSMQGLRETMEDRHDVSLDVAADYKLVSEQQEGATGTADKPHLSFFSIFDGHGGTECADFCSNKLCPLLIHFLGAAPVPAASGASVSGAELPKVEDQFNHLPSLDSFIHNIQQSDLMKKCFTEIDAHFARELKEERLEQGNTNWRKHSSGCTAVVVFVLTTRDDKESAVYHDIIVANTGDSRCVVYSKGTTVAMTRDHKPLNPEELERIYKAEGFVARRRVNGHLALSRAFGDFQDKANKSIPAEKQAVIAKPEIKKAEIATTTTTSSAESSDVDSELNFLVLACDGIFDVLTNEQVTDYIVQSIRKRNGDTSPQSLEVIATDLCKYCILEKGSTDNCTAMIVMLK